MTGQHGLDNWKAPGWEVEPSAPLPLPKRAHINNKAVKGRIWGLLDTFFIAICFICCSTLVYAIPKLSPDALEQLVLYWQPLVPITLMIWLWGYNIHQFENMGVPYETCFSAKEKRFLLPADEVFKTALVFTACVLSGATAYSYCCLHRLHSAALPIIAYVAMLLLLLAPINVLNPNSRFFFARTLARVLLPFQEVTWSDFLLADVFTSLSKCTSDIAKAACALAMGGPILSHNSHSRLANMQTPQCDQLGTHVLLALCLPYLIRFVQCLRVSRATGSTAQLFNAVKYASAFPALILSAIEHEYHVRGKHFPYTCWWLGAMALNTAYSCYWDIEMDWDMPWLMQTGSIQMGMLRLPAVKADAIYALPWYAWAVLSNLALRLTWMHRLLGNIENYNAVGLVIALLEAYRRYQWVYIRIEAEVRKIRLRTQHEHPKELGLSGL